MEEDKNEWQARGKKGAEEGVTRKSKKPAKWQRKKRVKLQDCTI